MKRTVFSGCVAVVCALMLGQEASALVYNYGPYDGSVKIVSANYNYYSQEWEAKPDAALLALIDMDAYYSAAKNVTQSGSEIVRVMNLWSQVDNGAARQDQLVLVPRSPSGGDDVVPDAGSTVALLGIALLGLGCFVRRK